MDREITASIPEHIYTRIQRMAELTGRSLADTLLQAITLLENEMHTVPVDALSDAALLELVDSQMDTTLSARMHVLQERQGMGSITPEEVAELQTLMNLYDAGQLRKTQALVEAVKRGLRAPGPR